MAERPQKSKARLVLAITLVALGVWLLFNHSAGVDHTLISSTGVHLQHVTLNDEPSPNAAVTVPFTTESGRYTFMNVAIDLNQDGRFADYTIDGALQREWVVENSAARALPDEPNTFSFHVFDTPAYDRTDLAVVVAYTDAEFTDWDGTLPGSRAAVAEATVASFERDEIGDLYQHAADGKGTTGFPSDFFGASVFANGDHIPHAPPAEYVAGTPNTQGSEIGTGDDVDGGDDADAHDGAGEEAPSFNEFHRGVPDIAQGRNECVPTSTANSLLWLAEEYDFELPSQNDIISELKNDFNWSAANGVVVPPHYLPGKRAFTERHDIPIETHQVGGRFDTGIVEKIAAELDKGQDVEIDMEYGRWDAGPNNDEYRRVGGHMVTVVGAQTVGGKQYLDIHDPLSRGPGRNDVYEIDGTRVDNYRYQGNSLTFIRFAIAESPITEDDSGTTIEGSDGEEESATAPGGGQDEGPTDNAPEPAEEITEGQTVIDVLVIDGGHYPAHQFRVAAPDACDDDHWHANGTVFGLASLEGTDIVSANDPNPGECGFGTTVHHPVESVVVTPEQQQELLKHTIN